jgi:predicted ATPase/DNA-binding SARP family transcriptional activator
MLERKIITPQAEASMPRLAVTLFGPPRIERDGCPVNTDTRKAIALIAYLAVTKQPHSRDTLAALLWPEYDQPHARATLRRTLSVLHKALAGAWLRIERETLSLDQQEGFWLDVEEFRENLAASRAHHVQPDLACATCLRHLENAATLYRDDFMAGFSLADSAPFDDWQFYQADSLRQDLAGVLEQLVLRYRARGDFSRAITHARRLLTLDRLHEPAHRYLMQLYAWSDQRTAALQQYRECVRLLNEELGVRPLEATIQLYTLIKENRLPPAPLLPPQENEADASTFIAMHPATQGQAPPVPALSAGGYPLVGRQEEWTDLRAIYAQKAPTGYVVGLEGEAGIGKTRLAEEFSSFARANGSRVITVRCYEGEVDLAYGPIAAALRTAIAQQEADWHRHLASHWLSETTRLLPELSELRPGLPAPPALDSPGAQSRFFEGLRQLWFVLCTRASQPALLFFDDIHWADEASLEFLSYLVRRLEEKPLCLLLTWRTAGRASGSRLQRLLAEAQRSGKARILTLTRLNQAMVEQLLGQMVVAGLQLSAGLIRHLYRETEGVPFFLTEYLTALSRGVLKAEEREWSLPGGVRDLLISRLAALGETSRQLLGTAATIGRSFDFDTLREVSGRSEEETVSGLEELIAQGLVEEIRAEAGSEAGSRPAHRRSSPAGERSLVYDFCHEKVRGLAYDEITLARRRLLHRRTAEALVARQRGRRAAGALAGQIAHHYAAGGESELAAEYFRQAGEYARSLYAHTEALAHFRAALALEHPAAAALQESLGDLHTFLGEYEAALKAYQEAELLNVEPRTRALLEQKQGTIYERRGEWEQAEKQFSSALQTLQEASAETAKEQARVYADWSLAAHRQGEIERARMYARLALDLAERAGDMRALAQAHNMLGILANSREEIEAARFHLQRSLALAEELQDNGIRAAALNNLALAYKAGGAIEQAIALTETALALCSSRGDRHREAALHSNLADLFHEAGRRDEAMNQLELAARIYAEIDIEAGTMRPEIWKLVEW